MREKQGTCNYEGYDNWLCEKFKMTLQEMYGDSELYKERNLGIVDMMAYPLNVFEFASCYGFLALEVMKRFPAIATYACTNFLPDVVDYTKKQGINSFLFDANDIPITDLTMYDTFICTSLEHLENDREIIRSLPKSNMYFCATNSYDRTHVWSFENEYDIFDRYRGIISIVDFQVFNFSDRKKIIFRGIK